jgi:hypothetical protein
VNHLKSLTYFRVCFPDKEREQRLGDGLFRESSRREKLCEVKPSKRATIKGDSVKMLMGAKARSLPGHLFYVSRYTSRV